MRGRRLKAGWLVVWLATVALGSASAANYGVSLDTDSYTADLPQRLFNLDYDPLLANRSFQIINRGRGGLLLADRYDFVGGISSESGYWTTAANRSAYTNEATHLPGAAQNSTWRLIPVANKPDTYLITMQQETKPDDGCYQMLWMNPAGEAKMTPNAWLAQAALDIRCQWRVLWDHDGWYRLVNLATGKELADTLSSPIGLAYRAVGSDSLSTPQANLYAEQMKTANEGRNLWRFRASSKVASKYSQYRPGLMANLRYGRGSPIACFNDSLPAASASVASTLRLMGNYSRASLGGTNRLVLLAAHRGVYGKLARSLPPVPENSILAIRQAAACGFESVELDVKLTADNQLVLIHDYSTGRVLPSNYTYSYGAAAMTGSDWDPRVTFPSSYVRPTWSDWPAPAGIKEEGDVWYWGDLRAEYSSAVPNIANPNLLMGSLDHWRWVDQRNPLVNQIARDGFRGIPLWGFDRFKATRLFGTGKELSYETVVTLKQALEYIADELPGLVVILDLRHKEEVEAAIDVIDDLAKSRVGADPRDWIILKPFGNALPGRWAERGTTPATLATKDANPLGSKAGSYYWIPVISGRIKYQAAPGTPSIRYFAAKNLDFAIAAPFGPDIGTLPDSSYSYLTKWWDNLPTNRPASATPNWSGNPSADNKRGLLAIELAIDPTWITPGSPGAGFADDDSARTKRSYQYFRGERHVPLIGPWRPADICDVDGLAAPFTGPFAGPAAPATLGYAWKDDGLGIYPVNKAGYTTLSAKATTADILTVDLGERVMATYLASGNRNASSLGNLLDPSPAEAAPPAPPTYGLSVGLRSITLGAYLGAHDGGLPGRRMLAEAPHFEAWERFSMSDLNGGDLEDGDQVSFRTLNGFFVGAKDGGGGAVLVDQAVSGPNMQFSLINVNAPGRPIRPGDVVAVRSLNGSYLRVFNDARGSGADFTAASIVDDAKFILTAAECRVALLNAHNGKYLSADAGGGAYRMLRSFTSTAQSWETFTLTDLNGGALQSGDAIWLQTCNRFFWRYTGSNIYFDSTKAGTATNRFIIERVDRGTRKISLAGTPITAGDSIVIKSSTSGDLLGLRSTTGPWDVGGTIALASGPLASGVVPDRALFTCEIRP